MTNQTNITTLARKLRRNSTPTEKLLWETLRNRKLSGEKFLRQHPIIYENLNGEKHFFISDFYCAKHKLVLELDGKTHDFQKEYDLNRDLVLKEMNLRVLRIKNEETNDMHRVFEKIRQFITNSPQ